MAVGVLWSADHGDYLHDCVAIISHGRSFQPLFFHCHFDFGSRFVHEVCSSMFSVLICFLNCSSSVQFVSLGAFFAHISDPLIGGTYMTLLNTLSNFGGTYPQYFILRAVDFFTDATCHHQPTSNSTIIHQPYKCNTAEMKKICKSEHGDCVIDQDGYYYVSSIMIIAGLLTFSMFIRPQILRLESLKTSSWRVGKGYKVG